jgi:hypothetical protein
METPFGAGITAGGYEVLRLRGCFAQDDKRECVNQQNRKEMRPWNPTLRDEHEEWSDRPNRPSI